MSFYVVVDPYEPNCSYLSPIFSCWDASPFLINVWEVKKKKKKQNWILISCQVEGPKMSSPLHSCHFLYDVY